MPSLARNISTTTFQRTLNLKEHPDSQPWRRIFNRDAAFIVLEPGFSQVRVGDQVVDLSWEVQMWRGQLYLPKNSIDRIKIALEGIEPDSKVYPQWTPIVEKGWQYIVLHHSGNHVGNATIFDRYHREVQGWSRGLGYHFVIGNGSRSKDGEIEVGSRWVKQIDGAHAKSPDNLYNREGIGICLVGDYMGVSQPTQAQINSLVKLVNFLRSRYNIPIENIVPHCDVPDGTVTQCPGDNFPWVQFMGRLGSVN